MFICALTIVSGVGGQTVRPRQQKVSDIPRRPSGYIWPPGTRSRIADMSGNVAFVVRPWPGAMGNIGATVEIRQHPAAEGPKTGAAGDAAEGGGAERWLFVADERRQNSETIGFQYKPPDSEPELSVNETPGSYHTQACC